MLKETKTNQNNGLSDGREEDCYEYNMGSDIYYQFNPVCDYLGLWSHRLAQIEQSISTVHRHRVWSLWALPSGHNPWAEVDTGGSPDRGQNTGIPDRRIYGVQNGVRLQIETCR